MVGMAMLDRRPGAPPLYAQLATLLDERIAEGRLRPGDQLPSEHELVAELGVSRATVIKAFESLTSRGLVVREHGRGTFVRERRMDRRLPELTGFSNHIREIGLRPGHRLLGLDRMAADDTDPVLAPFPVGTPLVALRRVRLADGEPVGLHRSVFRAELAERAGVSAEAFAVSGTSLYEMFDAVGVVLETAQQSLRAVNAQPHEAELLDVAPGEALMEVIRHSHDASGELVEVADARYLGSMYVYRIELERTQSGAGGSMTTKRNRE